MNNALFCVISFYQQDSRFYFLYKKKNEKRLFLYSLTAVSIFIRKWKSIVENDGISHCSSGFGGCRNGQQQAQLQNRERPLVSLRYQGAFLFYFYFKVFRT